MRPAPTPRSGHFLVAAFELLRRMRMEEEGLSEAAAAEATLRDNIHGLELDARCTQLAAFALAFAAWKAGGYRPLPALNIACSGIPVQGQLADWTALAAGDDRLRTALERLYHLFKHAPDLGSLINPADLPLRERMFTADYAEVEPLLEQALGREKRDPAAEVFGAAAEGVAKAARLLARKYTLVATNVPYLGLSNQGEQLRNFGEQYYSNAKADLATIFVERCRAFCFPRGSYAVVTPHNWLFLVSYKRLRKESLEEQTWNTVAMLGAQAFQTPMWDFKIVLLIISNLAPTGEHTICGIDAGQSNSIADKMRVLATGVIREATQSKLLNSIDSVVSFASKNGARPFGEFIDCLQGISSADYPRFGRFFWEMPALIKGWAFQQGTVSTTIAYGGRENVLWLDKLLEHAGELKAAIRGRVAWGKKGVAISQMAKLPGTLYTGEAFINSVPVILPKRPEYLPAIWAFCSSTEFPEAVREVNPKLSVDNGYIGKIPFDLARWQKVAEEAGPLPEPYSADPTQWLFNGRPAGSDAPLQVAVARLLGYRWPQQEYDGLDLLADEDGIACLPAVARELPAEERLRALLAKAYGADWNGNVQAQLLAGVGAKDLGAWLRDDFFKQHCATFHNRPFIWHIWDGRKDGFAALVNYHKLDAARLDKLIYTYLGSWIETQRAAVKRGEAGADGRLVAALELQKKLEAIKVGEPPYDIYVRWKSLAEQPIGWNPDLNDGVRLNIRPFVKAEVLRAKFTINWNKDRGTNPDGSERLNELLKPYTNEQKLKARGG